MDHYPGLNTWVEQNIELRAKCDKDGWFVPKLWEHIKNSLTYVLNQMVNIVAQEDLDHPEKVESGESYPPAIIDRLNVLLTIVPATTLIPKRRVPHQPKLKKRYRQDYLKPGQIPNSKKSKSTNANPGKATPVVKPMTSTSVPDVLDVLDVPDVPDVPDVSDVPDVPDVPDVTDVPDVPDVPDVLVHDSPAQDLPVAKKQKKTVDTIAYVEADDSEFDSDEEESEEEEEVEEEVEDSTGSIDNKFGSTSKDQREAV